MHLLTTEQHSLEHVCQNPHIVITGEQSHQPKLSCISQKLTSPSSFSLSTKLTAGQAAGMLTLTLMPTSQM